MLDCTSGSPVLDYTQIYLGEAFVQAIYILKRLGTGKREHIGPQPYDIPILLVQADLGYVRSSSPDIPEAPTVSQRGKERSGILV